MNQRTQKTFCLAKLFTTQPASHAHKTHPCIISLTHLGHNFSQLNYAVAAQTLQKQRKTAGLVVLVASVKVRILNDKITHNEGKNYEKSTESVW